MKAKVAHSKSNREARYKEYVNQIRDLRSRGAADEVAAMRLVLEFEKASFAWKDSSTSKFEEVIKDERFCTVARWRAFKKAASTIAAKHIDRLGVPAACLIAAQSKNVNFRLIKIALQFRDNHGIEPTYQYVSQWLRARKPKLDRPTYGELTAYIEVLKAKIIRLKGKVPPMEASHA